MQRKKCTRFFLALASELFFNLIPSLIKALKYLSSDDVNINDQLIGVDQRSLLANNYFYVVRRFMNYREDALKFSATRNLWGQSFIGEGTKRLEQQWYEEKVFFFERRSMEWMILKLFILRSLPVILLNCSRAKINKAATKSSQNNSEREEIFLIDFHCDI